MCRIGNFVGDLYGGHNNLGDNAHTGYVRIADNHNQAFNGPSLIVVPGSHHVTPVWRINQNWQKGHRVCAVWVKSNGTYTSGYACWTL